MKVLDIISFLTPISYQLVDNEDVDNVLSIDDIDFSNGSIGWCSDKNLKILFDINAGTIILSAYLADEFLKLKGAFPFNVIIVESPRKSFASMLKHFFVEKMEWKGIHVSAVIDHSVQIDVSNCTIEPNVVIEPNVKIGKRVIIGANTVIKSGTIIHDDVKIGSNNTIGGVGFGYEPNEDGIYELIPHIGNVILYNKVEIGNNTCIDRAVLGSTILGEEVKVDNLVHIAHGVKIGANSLVIANAMVAGSVQIGKNTWVSPSASIKQKLKIGDNALVGMGSVVLKDVEDNAIVAGVPAKKIN